METEAERTDHPLPQPAGTVDRGRHDVYYAMATVPKPSIAGVATSPRTCTNLRAAANGSRGEARREAKFRSVSSEYGRPLAAKRDRTLWASRGPPDDASSGIIVYPPSLVLVSRSCAATAAATSAASAAVWCAASSPRGRSSSVPAGALGQKAAHSASLLKRESTELGTGRMASSPTQSVHEMRLTRLHGEACLRRLRTGKGSDRCVSCWLLQRRSRP
jgi:hypothetical protein